MYKCMHVCVFKLYVSCIIYYNCYIKDQKAFSAGALCSYRYIQVLLFSCDFTFLNCQFCVVFENLLSEFLQGAITLLCTCLFLEFEKVVYLINVSNCDESQPANKLFA